MRFIETSIFQLFYGGFELIAKNLGLYLRSDISSVILWGDSLCPPQEYSKEARD